MATLDNLGFIANVVSLVMYFMTVLHFDLSGSSNTLTNFMGSTFMVTVLGGFISDTYLTRLNTVLLFGVLEILGYILMTIQAYEKSLRPDVNCLTCHLEGGNSHMFYASLSLLALGYGGVRGSLPALGAEQFDKKHPKEREQLASFFNWLLFSITLGGSIGVTVLVWVSSERSWSLGFLLDLLLSLLGFAFVVAGTRFYRLRPPGDSPLNTVAQVIRAAIRNRKLTLPKSSDELYETINDDDDDDDDVEKIQHTDQFRWLDKAAILQPQESDKPLAAEEAEIKVCSVTQVEEVKILIRMLPILGSTILMNTCLAQLQTFSIHQGYIMNLYLGNFRIPPSSIPVIPLLFMAILIPIYEFVFVPFVRRFTGHPSGITHLQRVGVGLVLSAISMAVAGFVEVKRKNAFNKEYKQLSVFWLSYQYGIFGIADMFTFVGLLEFFYSEAPVGMRSLSVSFTFLSLSFGYFLSTVFVDVINSVTSSLSSNKQGWLVGLDLNSNHLERFYWFLSILSCLNFVIYLLCATWYKYRKEAAPAPAMPNTKTNKSDASSVEHMNDDQINGAAAAAAPAAENDSSRCGENTELIKVTEETGKPVAQYSVDDTDQVKVTEESGCGNGTEQLELIKEDVNDHQNLCVNGISNPSNVSHFDDKSAGL
ncbi:Proton-dependent oligopeptide transporter family protein [Dioscorea alata]|uniref:Proton-dependent oligopeptide transporter family protein n=1 Tax=Dioscorea alata TaxID=55571 RepID=A0ACB7U4S4_DIOAL|nr:Proton-dependent oligopeptide transporter family protein [Dioscorea alata]